MTAMKMFLLGAPCAGKTTLALGLREVLSCPVLDMDEELSSNQNSSPPRRERSCGWSW
jgi:shikimate kinase